MITAGGNPDRLRSEASSGSSNARSPAKCLSSSPDPTKTSEYTTSAQAKNITLTAAARALGLDPMTSSRTEHGRNIPPDLVNRYRAWLNTA